MSQITLVRHGQANTAARDEVSYDQLSELGARQAGWLGAHLGDAGEVFAHCYRGGLHRHRQTADAMGIEGAETDARFDEMEFFTIAHLFEAQHGVAIPDTREDFVQFMPRMLAAWQTDEIADTPESFADFETRVGAGLRDLMQNDGRSIVITSGGVIGMAMRITLGLSLEAMARVCLAIENTSLSRWLPLEGHLALTQFNALPHLEGPDRQFARTHL